MRLGADTCDVYRVADEGYSPERWRLMARGVLVRITALTVRGAGRVALAGLALERTPTHQGRCEPNPEVRGTRDRTLLVRKSDGAQFLVLRTQQADMVRGQPRELVLLLAETTGEELSE